MNRQQLQTAVQSYTKRTNQAVEDWDTWFAVVEAKLWRELRVEANEQGAVLTVAAFPAPVPAAYRSMRVLVNPAGKPLRAVNPSLLQALTMTGALAAVYAVSGGQLDVRARVTGDYVLTFWGELQALTLPTDSNGVSTKHPELYLSGLMAEAMKWEGDADGAVAYTGDLDALIEKANGAAQADRY